MSSAIYSSALRGDKDAVISMILNEGVHPIVSSTSNVLHAACANGHADLIEGIIGIKAQLRSRFNVSIKELLFQRDGLGKRPIHLAARSGSFDSVSALVNALVDEDEDEEFLLLMLQSTDDQKRTPLHFITMNDHSDLVQLVHSAVGRDDEEDAAQLFKMVDSDGNSPLHLACLFGSPSCVELCYELSDCAAKNAHGLTPLHLACLNDQKAIVEILLTAASAPAFLNAEDNHGRTPVAAAASVCSIDCLELVLEAGGKPGVDETGRTAIMWCISSKPSFRNFELCVDALTASGVSLTASDAKGWSALHYAASLGRFDIWEYLASQVDVIKPSPDVYGLTLLHAAAQRYQKSGSTFAAILNKLAEKDDVAALLSAQDKKGRTPLHFAAAAGSTEIVSVILQNIEGNARKILDGTDKAGRTPLHYASKRDEVAVATLLVEAGASVSIADRSGLTIAHLASQIGSIGILDLAKRSVRASHFLKVIHSKDRLNGVMPHHLAAANNKCQCLQWFMEHKAPLNFGSKTGKLAIHYAARNGAEEAVRFLAMQGESPKKAERTHGFTSLHAAALGNHSNVIAFLLDNGCKLDNPDKRGRTLFHYAVILNQPHDLVKWAARGADVNCRDKEGATPLHLACYLNAVQCVKDLIDLDGDIKAVDNKGRNAVHYAALGGSVASLDFLLDHGGDAHHCDNNGRSVLDAVACGGDDEGNLGCLSRLLARINPNCPDSNGRLPLHAAALMGHVEMCRNYIQFYSGTKADDQKSTALHYLVRGCGHQEGESCENEDVKVRVAIGQLLIRHGASVSAKDLNGVTPLMLAAYYNVTPLVELFQQHDTSEKSVYDNAGRDFEHYAEMGERKREDMKKESMEMKEKRRAIKAEQDKLLEEEMRERTASAAVDVTPEYVIGLRDSMLEMREQNQLLRATEQVLRQQLKEADSRARTAEAKLGKMETRCKMLTAQIRALRDGDLSEGE